MEETTLRMGLAAGWAPVILRLRNETGLSQEKFAGRIDVSRGTLRAWEKGEAWPEPEQIEKVAKFCQIDPYSLNQEVAVEARRAQLKIIKTPQSGKSRARRQKGMGTYPQSSADLPSPDPVRVPISL